MECSGRGGPGGRTREKQEATREKLLEMAVPTMQRERLERLDMFDMRMGMKLIKQWSGDSAEPAGF